MRLFYIRRGARRKFYRHDDTMAENVEELEETLCTVVLHRTMITCCVTFCRKEATIRTLLGRNVVNSCWLLSVILGTFF